MSSTCIKGLFLTVFLCSVIFSKSQSNGLPPETLKLSTATLQHILKSLPGTVLNTTEADAFKRILILKHTHQGDMEFIQAQLPDFMNYYLNIQINGVYSIILHLLPAAPKSNQNETWSYTGTKHESEIIFTRTATDALYSE
jgi:hypothetical protein